MTKENDAVAKKLAQMIEDQMGELTIYRNSNSDISERQITGIHAIIKYCTDELKEMRHDIKITVSVEESNLLGNMGREMVGKNTRNTKNGKRFSKMKRGLTHE